MEVCLFVQESAFLGPIPTVLMRNQILLQDHKRQTADCQVDIYHSHNSSHFTDIHETVSNKPNSIFLQLETADCQPGIYYYFLHTSYHVISILRNAD